MLRHLTNPAPFARCAVSRFAAIVIDSSSVLAIAGDAESRREAIERDYDQHLATLFEHFQRNPEVDVDFLMTPRFVPTASPTVWNLTLDTHDLPADCIEPSVTVASDDSGRFGCNAVQRTTTRPLRNRIGSISTTLLR